jgi:hypothetical protein
MRRKKKRARQAKNLSNFLLCHFLVIIAEAVMVVEILEIFSVYLVRICL